LKLMSLLKSNCKKKKRRCSIFRPVWQIATRTSRLRSIA
jgi:hypothetical protein